MVKDYKMSGEVVFPPLGEDVLLINSDVVTQVKIDGPQYKLCESQISDWIDLYGVIQGELEEEAVVDEVDFSLISTSANLAVVRHHKIMPHLIPVYGLKILISHSGISKICKNCYQHHKKDLGFLKRYWHEYVIQFKAYILKIEREVIE
jgi:hypothetical protein